MWAQTWGFGGGVGGLGFGCPGLLAAAAVLVGGGAAGRQGGRHSGGESLLLGSLRVTNALRSRNSFL